MNVKSLIISTIIGYASLGISPFTLDAAENSSADSDNIAKEIKTFLDEPAFDGISKKLSVSTTVAFESEYVFRGRSVTGPSINPAADIGCDIGNGFGASLGYWGNYNTSDTSFPCSENDFTAGLSYTAENISVEFGYTAYTYTSGGNSNEIKVGATYDTSDLFGDYNVSPYAAAYYDITLSGKTLEGGLSYSAPVTKWIFESDWGTIDLSGYLGYTYGDISLDPLGHSYYDGYFYAGLAAGATIAISADCSFSAGMRYAYCNDYDSSGTTNSRLWFGTSLSFGF